MFITFEGLEGSGKTSQIPILDSYLREAEYSVFCTREPGGTPIGDQIREVLLTRENTAMHQHTEILLFQASRSQLVEEVIRPRLKKGEIVLCDRYADSTIAYQGYGLEVDLAQVRTIVDFATGGLKPDLTLFLEVDVEAGLQRRNQHGDVNRLDVKNLDYYRRVRAGYYEMMKAEPERWEIIDANKPSNEVQTALREIVLARLKENGRVG
ncbi:MAG: dTMP kinase [Chloroflexi bacterium]|nr:dTMP kinase [Chloroflexota bacterium]